jgi:transaldolase
MPPFPRSSRCSPAASPTPGAIRSRSCGACKAALRALPKAELLWASPRELLNVFHAQEAGADIITMTPDMLAKLKGIGKDLTEFSRETVEMFYRDAQAAAYTIALPQTTAA